MTHRPAALALTVSLCCLAVAGCASVDAPAYPTVVERAVGPAIGADGGLAGTRLGAPVTPTLATRMPVAVPAAVRPPLLAAIAPAADPARTASGGGAAVGILESGRTITLYASDDAFRAEYETDAERFDLDSARLTGGFLLSEERDNVFTGTVMLDTFPGLVRDVRLSLGTRAYVALLGIENRDVFGLGIGVQGAYELPVDFLPLQLGSEFFYTPDVLAFGQSDRIVDWNVDVGLAVRDNISAFVGFRFLQFDTRPGDREVEDDLHVGVRWAFEADGEAVVDAGTAPANPPRFR